MKIKNIIVSCIMSMILVFSGTINVGAEEVLDQKEWYDISVIDINQANEMPNLEIQPLSTRYIMDIVSSLKKMGPRTVALRSDVYCSSVMKKVEVYIQLQKLKNNTWVTVGEANSTSYNEDYVAKEGEVQNLRPGVYRCKSFAIVTDDYGYSEMLSSASGGVTFP